MERKPAGSGIGVFARDSTSKDLELWIISMNKVQSAEKIPNSD
jgi:hypothetical protein